MKIDYSRDDFLTDFAKEILRDRYMLPEEKSPQDAFARAARAFADDEDHAQRLYDYASKLWFMFSTPILSNGGTTRGLPISCFLNYVPDSRTGLAAHYEENIFLSSVGGGIGGYWGAIRSQGESTSIGNKTTGVIPFMHVADSQMLAFNQGACYTPDTEVLTSTGFKLLSDLTYSDLVYNVGPEGGVFAAPIDIVEEDYDGNLVHVSGPNLDLKVTANHSMVIERRVTAGWSGKYEKIRADSVKYHRDVRTHTSCPVALAGRELTPVERLEIAYQADGTESKYLSHAAETTQIAFRFKKERKIERMRDLLAACEYYNYTKTTDDGVTEFRISAPQNFNRRKDFAQFDLSSFGSRTARDFLDELMHWDGSKNRANGAFKYSNTNYEAVKFVQAVCVLAGRKASFSVVRETDEIRQPLYSVYVMEKYSGVSGECTVKTSSSYKGKVYCCVVPTGMIVVRRNGCVAVCGNTRRGSYAAYIDISHPEVEEFLIMRKPTGGDVNRKNLNLHHGVNVTDDFMQAVVKGEEWPLVDPNSKKVTKVVWARELWHRILEIRYETGEPYLHFIDTSNRYMPEPLKEKGLRINNSNLCSEIYLPTAEDRTAVCCLSSVNLEKYDEWGTDMLFIEDLMRMLDNVLTYFIENAPAPLWRAVASAKAERSVGLGAMGWHAWLQKNGIPFESPVAVGQVHQIHKSMFIKAHMASKKLAAERGEAPDMAGTGLRFAHMFAVAPNASSSIICGTTSPSIEPWRANAFAQKTLSGSFLVRNPYLEEALLGYDEYKADVEGFWSSVYGNKGSVQHVAWLSDAHKEVFKTATEIDQHWVIEHAVARQQYIDQGQSVNLFFPEGCDKSYINSVHLNAWKGQLKGLYYLRSEAVKRAETVSKKVERVIRPDFAEEQTCLSCEG